jgi:hypothetical protein
MISLSKASRHDLNKLDVRCRRGMAAKAAIRLLTAMSMSDILGLGCHSRSAAVGLGRENAFIASSCSVAWRDFCAWPSLVYLLEFSPERMRPPLFFRSPPSLMPLLPRSSAFPV